MDENKMSMHRGMTIEKALRSYTERVEKMNVKRCRTIRWIALREDGCVSRETQALDYKNVCFNIPIYPLYRNKQGRLLFCYDDGRVNVIDIKEVFKDKLREKGLKKNGYNKKDGRKLLRAFVCDKDDYLVICSIDAAGKKFIKAELLDKRTPHPNMLTPGNLFVKDARPYKWMVFPGTLKDWLKPIILNGRTDKGTPLESYASFAQLVELDQCAAEMNPPAIVCVQPQ